MTYFFLFCFVFSGMLLFQTYTKRKVIERLKLREKELSQISGAYESAQEKVKRLKAKLKESSEQVERAHLDHTALKEVLDFLPCPIWARDLQKGLIYCNKSYANLLNTTIENTLRGNQKLWRSSKGLEDQHVLPYAFQQHLIHDGERSLFEFYEHSLHHSSTIWGYALDQTHTEKAKIELEHHISAYREVLKNLSAGVLVIGPDQCVRAFNHAYVRMFKMSEEWLCAGPHFGEVLDNLHERQLLTERPDYSQFKKQALELITTLLSPVQELLHLPDGRTLRKIMAPHPMGGVFYIFEDLTDSLTLERQYNTQLAVHRASLDNLYEGVAVFGGDNRLRLCNPAFKKMWNLTDDQTKGDIHLAEMIEHIKGFFPQSRWNEFKANLISSITDRSPKKRRIRRLDGSILQFSYIPLPDGSNLTSYISVEPETKPKRIPKEAKTGESSHVSHLKVV